MTDNHDLVLDLNFVPAWARQPPSLMSRPDDMDADKADTSIRKQGRFRPGRRDDSQNGKQRRFRSGDSGRRTERERSNTRQAGEGAGGSDSNRAVSKEPLPLAISFLPERHGLKPLIKHLAKTRLAFPLLDLAAMFLSKPEYYAVKLESAVPADGKPSLTIWQCTACFAVFLDRDRLIAHALRAHFDDYYATEQRPGETPKGQFKCVAKCGLSGQILGPPNYHGYNERLIELHGARFSSMPLEEYRKRIVNESDPALIEQWKQEASIQTVFRTLKAANPLEFTRRAEVEAHFIGTYASKIARKGDRFIIGGVISRGLEDTDLHSAIRHAWVQENRFPWRLSVVLRPAFRQHKLHIFRASDRHWFVSAVAPAPLSSETNTTPVVREILDCLQARPGITRQEVAAVLRPDAPADSPEATGLMREIFWLRDRGHIIEFQDGRLAVLNTAPAKSAEDPAAANSRDTAGAQTVDASTQDAPGHG